MPRKYGIKGRTNAFIKNKENWKTIVPNIKAAMLKFLTKQPDLASPIIFLNLKPSEALKLLSTVPRLKTKKSTFLLYKQILYGLSKYRRWLSTLYLEGSKEMIHDIDMNVLKFIEEGSSKIKKQGFYTPKSLLMHVMENDTKLARRSITKKLIVKVKECLLNHCNKKFGTVVFSDNFIKRVCEVGFEINEQSEKSSLITKTMLTLETDDDENVDPFFKKLPNNFLAFLKKLKLPLNFNGIFKEFVDRPLILRIIAEEVHNTRMKKIIIKFIDKIKAFILEKEKLSDNEQQNKINFFRRFENMKTKLEFKKMLEKYYIYLTKRSLYFFNKNNEINEINKINEINENNVINKNNVINNLDIYKRIYIAIFLIEDGYYRLKTRIGNNSLKRQLSKMARVFKINKSSYPQLFTKKKLITNLDYEILEKELKEVLSRLLMYCLIEPFASKRLSPNPFDANFLSVLKLTNNQTDFLNSLGILTVQVPHPLLEYSKPLKTPSSLGMNPDTKSVRISLRAMNPTLLIKIRNKLGLYQNYSWFCLSLYEPISAIHESLKTHYLNRFQGPSYKIRLTFSGILFKYEEDISAASQIRFNVNLRYMNNTYTISDDNLEADFFKQSRKYFDNSNVCQTFVHRLSYLLNTEYKNIKIDKATKEAVNKSQSPSTKKEKYDKSNRISPANQLETTLPKDDEDKDKDKDKDLPNMIDKWDSIWEKDSEEAATVYILNKVDVTVYQTNLTYMSKEQFFPLLSITDDAIINLPSIILAENLLKIQNSCLNLYTISILNTIFDLNFNRLSDTVLEYRTKLMKAIENPTFSTHLKIFNILGIDQTCYIWYRL